MKETVESLGRVRFQGMLLLVVVFVIGGIVGVVLDRVNPWRDRHPRLGSELRERMGGPGELPRFFNELDLTEAQKEQILEVFAAQRPILDSVMAETMPRIRAVRDSAEAAISAILTPEQREKFEKLQPKHRFPLGRWRGGFDSSRFDEPLPPPGEPR